MSKGHRSEVPELYCVFASKTLQRKAPFEGCLCWRATKACHEVEKHLSSPSAVEALLDGVVSEGVLYFCTPLGRTLTRTL